MQAREDRRAEVHRLAQELGVWTDQLAFDKLRAAWMRCGVCALGMVSCANEQHRKLSRLWELTRWPGAELRPSDYIEQLIRKPGYATGAPGRAALTTDRAAAEATRRGNEVP